MSKKARKSVTIDHATQRVITKAIRTGRDKIASAVTAGLKTVETTGNLVEIVCRAVHTVYKGEAIPKEDIAYITGEVATQRGWKAASIRVRSAEVASILGAYATLPEAITRAKKKVTSFTWHNAVSIARSLNKGQSVPKAVAAFTANRKSGSIDPKTIAAKVAKGKAATSIKNLLKMTKLPASFRSGLRTLCEDNGINV